MKTLLILLLITTSFTGLFSQEQAQISLTITYEGKALCDWDVTVKIGDAVLGKGVTDKSGYIKFNQATLIAKDVDVYGYKKTANGEKKWDMKGYVKLDDNYYYHIKMETVVEEATKDGGLPKSMLLDAWGLTSLNCDGSVTTNENNNTNNSSTNNTINNSENKNETIDPNAGLQQQKVGYQNQINSYEKRIPKKQAELEEKKAKGLMAPIDEKIEQLEIDELKFKLEDRKIGLERINKSIDKTITEEQSKEYLALESNYKSQANKADDERKKLIKEKKDAEKTTNNSSDKEKKTTGEKVDNAGLKMKIKYYKSEIKTQEKAVVRLQNKGKTEEVAKKEENIKELKLKLAEAEAKLSTK